MRSTNFESLFLLLMMGVYFGPLLILLIIKALYSAASFRPLESIKPERVLWPKYRFHLPIHAEEASEQAIVTALTVQLAKWGVKIKPNQRHNRTKLTYMHVPSMGRHGKVKLMVEVVAKRPLQNPVELEVTYGTTFGKLYDHGQLWTLSKVLGLDPPDSDYALNMEEMEEVRLRAEQAEETGNPFQPPLT